MVIMRIMGGLGNQLACFAFGYTISNYLNQPLVLDISHYKWGYFREFLLDNLTLPKYEKIYYELGDNNPFYLESLSPAIINAVDCIVDSEKISNREELLHEIDGHQNVYACGYGGVAYCTEEEVNLLRSSVKLIGEWRKLESFQKSFCGKRNVAVHVRRTDFLLEEWANDSWKYYYLDAIDYMRGAYSDCRFYVFSDDCMWARETFHGDDIEVFENVGGEWHSIEDLYCMASCDDFILTNKSSFGWWASFFSETTDGISIFNGNVEFEESMQQPSNIRKIHLLKSDMDETRDFSLKQVSERKNENIPLQNKLVTKQYLEQLITENENEKVIDSVNDYAGTGLSKSKLLEYKGIALFQNGNINAARDCFEMLLMSGMKNPDTLFNYALIQENCGRHLRALAYAARAKAFGVGVDVLDYIFPKNEIEIEIIRTFLLSDERTYYFPVESMSRYFIMELESIQIFMRMLGYCTKKIQSTDEIEDGNNAVIVTESNLLYEKYATSNLPTVIIEKEVADKAIHTIDIPMYNKEKGVDTENIVLQTMRVLRSKIEI